MSDPFEEVTALCKAAAVEATKEMIALLKSDDERIRMAVVKEILDKAFGGRDKDKAKDADEDQRKKLLAELQGTLDKKKT